MMRSQAFMIAWVRRSFWANMNGWNTNAFNITFNWNKLREHQKTSKIYFYYREPIHIEKTRGRFVNLKSKVSFSFATFSLPT